MSMRYQLVTMSIIALACTTTAFAAKPIDLNNQPVSAIQFLTKSPATLAGTSTTALKEMSRDTDQNTTTHIRVQETFANYPVWGGDAILHVPQGSNKSLANLSAATTMNGVVYQDLQADLANTPAYVFETAQAEKALQHAAALYQQKTGIKQFDLAHAKKDLMVYIDKNNKAHWAYFISFLAKSSNGLAVPTYIIDATSFDIYLDWNNAQTLQDAQSGGFGGNEKMGKLIYDGTSGNYPALQIQRDAAKQICYLNNANVTVMDASKPHEWYMDAPIAEFGCKDKDSKHNNLYWNAGEDAINGAYSPANDALYIGQVIKEMYQKWYNMPVLSFFGFPMMLKMNVHTPSPEDGGPFENAMFLSLNSEMYYGDGLNHFYPLASLGVGAHEISHGFTSQHANLTYLAQSGGLNESFSDMAAQAAEFYSTGKNSWQIGPEIVKGTGALRYMDDPTKDGHSIGNAKDYVDGLNVHYSSGVFNKVFYLLSTTTNWDTKKAFDVMVNANMHYWTASSTFVDAACGAKKAAKDLKYDVAAVTAATQKVGIDTSRC